MGCNQYLKGTGDSDRRQSLTNKEIGILSAAAAHNYLLRTVGTCWQMLIAPVRTTLPPTDSYVETSARPKMFFWPPPLS